MKYIMPVHQSYVTVVTLAAGTKAGMIHFDDTKE